MTISRPDLQPVASKIISLLQEVIIVTLLKVGFIDRLMLLLANWIE